MQSSFSRSRRRNRSTMETHINIAPLVDVMLVLLVVFMVTAPMLTVGIPVNLPKTDAAQMNDQEEPLVVTINAQGQLYLQETHYSEADLIQKLKLLTRVNKEAKIYVRGDESLPYGRIMSTMGMIAKSGFEKVSLIAEAPSGSSSKEGQSAMRKKTA